MPEGYNNNGNTRERKVSSGRGKTAQTIGIIVLIIGGLILFGALGVPSVAVVFFGTFLIVISVLIIIRAGRRNERQAIKQLKNQSKAEHGLVLFLYFLAALALCYGLYSEYWLASESPIAFMFVGLTLLIVGGGLDERFGTILWIGDIFFEQAKERIAKTYTD
jgi:uncharacterized membrane protein HdeD (DUF308 family)